MAPVMVRDPAARDGPPLEVVLDALDDADCREIIRRLEGPMTAGEIAEAAGIPQSTAYRKLGLLSEASLLEEGTEIRADGHHTTRYELAFEEVLIALAEDRTLEVAITRPPRGPDERLASLWSEVRRET